MKLQSFFCPQCKKELKDCALLYAGKIKATCLNCGIILFMQDLETWKLRQKRVRQMRQRSLALKKYYSPLLDEKYFKSKKKKKKDFNPSKR